MSGCTRLLALDGRARTASARLRPALASVARLAGRDRGDRGRRDRDRDRSRLARERRGHVPGQHVSRLASCSRLRPPSRRSSGSVSRSPTCHGRFAHRPEIRWRGVLLPVPALVGAPLAFGVWILAMITHPGARYAGPAWLPGRLVVYLLVRRRERHGLLQDIEPTSSLPPGASSAGARSDEARGHRRGDGGDCRRAGEGAPRDGRGHLRRPRTPGVRARGPAAYGCRRACAHVARGSKGARGGQRRRGGDRDDPCPLDRPRDRRGGAASETQT